MTAKQKANAQRFKKAIAEAKKLRKKNPKLTQAQAVKQAWAILYKTGKIAGAKKTATKKPARKKATAKSYHKDTKSHNVKISVMSGVDKISDFSLLQIKKNNESIEKLSKVVLQNNEKVKTFVYNNPHWKKIFKKRNKEINDYIKTLKKQNTELKKHI